jgi:hypothetical protein
MKTFVLIEFAREIRMRNTTSLKNQDEKHNLIKKLG